MKPSPVISWSILALGITALGVLIISEAQSFQDREDGLQQTLQLVDKSQRSVARRSALALELDTLKGELPEEPRWPGATAELAQLNMQEDVRALLTRSDLKVTRTTPLPAEDSSLALAVTASGPIEKIQLGLYAIEQHSPLIIVEELRIRPSEENLLKIDLKLASSQGGAGQRN